MHAVTVENLSKNYRIYSKPSARLKELIFRRRCHQDFWALREVDFQVEQGATFGIVGENGSGKSTLLQIIAGTMTPTTGSVALSGRVAALLELGAGFNSEFTGRENAVLNAAIMGLGREEIDRKMPEIEQFAEIGSFMDQAVKTYSSGMYVRLAFATAINLDPEILLVDESLAVGDVYFQQRCVRRLRRMRDEGKTILLVSHDVAAIRNLCDAAIWLEQGRIRDRGAPDKVTARYLAALTQRRDPYAGEKASEATQLQPDAAADAAGDLSVHTLPNVDERWGNGHARVLGIRLLDQAGREPQSLFHGDLATVRVSGPVRPPGGIAPDRDSHAQPPGRGDLRKQHVGGEPAVAAGPAGPDLHGGLPSAASGAAAGPLPSHPGGGQRDPSRFGDLRLGGERPQPDPEAAGDGLRLPEDGLPH